MNLRQQAFHSTTESTPPVRAETEMVNIRIDFGWGNGGSGFFLSLGEAF